LTRKLYALPFLFILLVLSIPPDARAQTITSPTADLWTAVPDSDLVVSLNVRRILNDALPRILGDDPAGGKDLQDELAAIEVVTGLDLRRVTRAVVGARLAGTGMDVNFQELALIAEGEFNYTNIKNAAKGPNREMREEKYGTDTLLIFRASDDPKAKKNELVAVVMLGPNLMAAGYVNAVKRAIDAFRDGKGRASPDLLARSQSDPEALVSAAARIPATYLQPKGIGTPSIRLTRLLSSIKALEAALHFGEDSFPLTVAIRSDSADSAGEIKCMLESIRTVADFALTDKALLKMLDDLKITQDGNAAAVQTEISVDQIRSIVNPPRPAPTTKPAKP
jgi:hypothetical protein